MELKKVQVYILGLTVRNTMELGLTVNNTERAISQLPKEKTEKVFGKAESESSGLKKQQRHLHKMKSH